MLQGTHKIEQAGSLKFRAGSNQRVAVKNRPDSDPPPKREEAMRKPWRGLYVGDMGKHQINYQLCSQVVPMWLVPAAIWEICGVARW
jgi:hypothetical protein